MKKLLVENVSKQFSTKTALEQINLEFESGNIYTIYGENGAGKSTLASILSNQIQPSTGKLTFINSEKTSNPKINIEIVTQHPIINSELTILEHCKLVYNKKDLINKIENIFTTWNFNLKLNKKGKELSSAEKFYTHLLFTLLKSIDFLILDEPTSFLDLSQRNILYSGIVSFINQDRNNRCVIIITHYPEETFSITSKIIVLQKAKVLFSNASIEQIKNISNQNILPIKTENIKNDCIMQFSNISSLSKNLTSIFDISFCILENQINFIHGSRESGLETIEEIITGINSITYSGNIKYKNTEITNQYNIQWLRQHNIGIVPSNKITRGSNPNLSIDEFLFPFSDEERKTIFTNAKINSTINESLCNLSGGMLQRLILQREIFFTHSILFLFEPDQGLDSQARTELAKTLILLTKKNISILILSSSNEKEIESISTNKYFIKGGFINHE